MIGMVDSKLIILLLSYYFILLHLPVYIYYYNTSLYYVRVYPIFYIS